MRNIRLKKYSYLALWGALGGGGGRGLALWGQARPRGGTGAGGGGIPSEPRRGGARGDPCGRVGALFLPDAPGADPGLL